jgi:hypothetical protein
VDARVRHRQHARRGVPHDEVLVSEGAAELKRRDASTAVTGYPVPTEHAKTLAHVEELAAAIPGSDWPLAELRSDNKARRERQALHREQFNSGPTPIQRTHRKEVLDRERDNVVRKLKDHSLSRRVGVATKREVDESASPLSSVKGLWHDRRRNLSLGCFGVSDRVEVPVEVLRAPACSGGGVKRAGPGRSRGTASSIREPRCT